MAVATRAAQRAGRHFRRRYPDMFTEAGVVHPVRGSEGYSELEERAGRLRGERARRLEDERYAYEAHEAGRQVSERARHYFELRDAVLEQGGIRATRDYPREDIPNDVYRANGRPPDELPLRLEEPYGFHYEDADSMLEALRKGRRAVIASGQLEEHQRGPRRRTRGLFTRQPARARRRADPGPR